MSSSAALLSRLLDLHPRRIDLSLERVERLLEALGRPQDRLPPVVHVAGTNGKGSTIAFLRAIFEAAGLKVHVYSSPHLVRFNERIRVAGKLVDEPILAEALQAVEAANAGAGITFFEATTAAALKIFADRPADVLLLEVGLGGRFDATNVIAHPACAVITPISIDHVEFLGHDLASIAYEKAGILKRGAPAVFSAQDDVALSVLERQAARLGVRPRMFGQDFLCRNERGRMVYEDEQGLLDLPLPKLSGRHQLINAGTAIAAARQIAPQLASEGFERAMGSAVWPGRLQNFTRGLLVETLPDGAELWLDGGHNAAGGKVLAEAMADFEEKASRPLALIYGGLKSKDVAGFLDPFRGLACELHAIPLHADQAARSPEDIAAIARDMGFVSFAHDSVEAALQSVARRNFDAPPRVLIAGSLYLVGEILRLNGTPPD